MQTNNGEEKRHWIHAAIVWAKRFRAAAGDLYRGTIPYTGDFFL